jgi:hypothetical protein
LEGAEGERWALLSVTISEARLTNCLLRERGWRGEVGGQIIAREEVCLLICWREMLNDE